MPKKNAPVSPFHLALGRAIRQLRSERGLTQEELALDADLDRAYLGRIERGEQNVAYTNLLLIAETIGVPTSEVVALSERLVDD